VRNQHGMGNAGKALRRGKKRKIQAQGIMVGSGSQEDFQGKTGRSRVLRTQRSGRGTGTFIVRRDWKKRNGRMATCSRKTCNCNRGEEGGGISEKIKQTDLSGGLFFFNWVAEKKLLGDNGGKENFQNEIKGDYWRNGK